MDLYRKLSDIFGIRVTEHNLRTVLPTISAKGGLGTKQLQEITVLLIEKVTELEHNTQYTKPVPASELVLTLNASDDKPELKPTGGKKK